MSVDARTGAINDYLPDLMPQGPCAKTLGRFESLGFQMPFPKEVVAYAQTLSGVAPLPQLADWQTATRPGAAVLIALDEAGQPCWGGLVLTRTTDHTEVAQLSTVTMEAYFDRRNVGPYNVIGRDQNLIVSDLINQFILDGTLPGLPIRVQSTASAKTQSVIFNDYDDKTIYSILGTMSGAAGGPQWTVNWEWQSSPTRITPVLVVADRIGSPVPAGLQPTATFSMPGCVQKYQLVEDYTGGKGANRVTATGSQGSGLTRPEDTENSTLPDGRPTYEYRYSPQQPPPPNATLTLQQHALAALAYLQDGTHTLTVTCDVKSAPVLNSDWSIGDDVGLNLMAPACIDGSLQDQIGRVVGWSRDDQTLTPVLFVQEASLL